MAPLRVHLIGFGAIARWWTIAQAHTCVMRTPTHAHTQTHTPTHTPTHTQTNTVSLSLSLSLSVSLCLSVSRARPLTKENTHRIVMSKIVPADQVSIAAVLVREGRQEAAKAGFTSSRARHYAPCAACVVARRTPLALCGWS